VLLVDCIFEDLFLSLNATLFYLLLKIVLVTIVLQSIHDIYSLHDCEVLIKDFSWR